MRDFPRRSSRLTVFHALATIVIAVTVVGSAGTATWAKSTWAKSSRNRDAASEQGNPVLPTVPRSADPCVTDEGYGRQMPCDSGDVGG